MNNKNLKLAGLVCCLIIGPNALAQRPAPQPLPDGAGKMLVENLCTTCHSTATISRAAGYGSAAEWRRVFSTMIELPDSQADTIAAYLASVDPDIPWHVSRFHPDYEMTDRGATPPEILTQACEWGRAEGLRYVYTGNVWGDDNESTRCPGCGAPVLERHGFRLGRVRMTDGRCDGCGTIIAGVGMP